MLIIYIHSNGYFNYFPLKLIKNALIVFLRNTWFCVSASIWKNQTNCDPTPPWNFVIYLYLVELSNCCHTKKKKKKKDSIFFIEGELCVKESDESVGSALPCDDSSSTIRHSSVEVRFHFLFVKCKLTV